MASYFNCSVIYIYLQKFCLIHFYHIRNTGAIALSYPLFLLMIHHEETRLNANRNPNPNPKGVWKCNSAEMPSYDSSFKQRCLIWFSRYSPFWFINPLKQFLCNFLLVFWFGWQHCTHVSCYTTRQVGLICFCFSKSNKWSSFV